MSSTFIFVHINVTHLRFLKLRMIVTVTQIQDVFEILRKNLFIFKMVCDTIMSQTVNSLNCLSLLEEEEENYTARHPCIMFEC